MGGQALRDHFCQIWQNVPCELGFISPAFFAAGRNVDRRFSIATCPCFDTPISYVLFAGLFAFKRCCFLELFLIYVYSYLKFLVYGDFGGSQNTQVLFMFKQNFISRYLSPLLNFLLTKNFTMCLPLSMGIIWGATVLLLCD